MKRLTEKYLNSTCIYKVLDVGSGDVNGTYKSLFSKSLYKGLDIAVGPNVDIVAPDTPWPVSDNDYDVVISGQCLEHVKAPWLWIKEVVRVCRPGGYIFIIAPANFPQHRFPVDCWRIMPDGMQYLLADWCGLNVLEVGIDYFRDDVHGPDHIDYNAQDCFGVARKKIGL